MKDPSLSRSHSRRLYRALIEFQMISEGDRILVGFSGGKDSAFLLYALSAIQQHSPVSFQLAAATVDLGFSLEDSINEEMKVFVAGLGIPHFITKTNIAKIAFNSKQKKNPCAICSHLRRGSLNSLAVENGFNKVALAHHRDDAVETFLMSILYSGQVHVFRPVTYLDRTGITVIRPLVYFKESEIKGAVKRLGYNPPTNPCPGQDETQRFQVKELIRSLSRENPMVYTNLFKALHINAVGELWPPTASKQEMKELHKVFFRGKHQSASIIGSRRSR
ncbi:MAG: tRNA 2-thiocytidine biosynthesis protein TtcA [Firmicutes bacterium]|nr:tRNA 2-thiocytidine biosynthesis protein TtcA [Bacillota bacterium]HXL04904.1 ATP-binding protein [Bacillota bacterium]